MRGQRFLLILVAFGVWLLGGGVLYAASPSPSTSIALQLDALASFPDARVAGETIHALPLVTAFYAQREYRPAWTNAKGPLPQADELVLALAAANQEGLQPSDYHLGVIRSLMAALRAPQTSQEASRIAVTARLELLLTDAFITYGSHLARGRVDPEKIYDNWQLYPRNVDPVQLLQKALADNRIAASLDALLPEKNGYFHLRQALAHYRGIERQGGWPTIPYGPKLQLGDRDARVAMVRHRLKISGDLAPDDSGGELFDAALEAAVRHFQQRMGLLVDGIVGSRTLAAMNVPVAHRVRQIVLNMERLRWLPRELGKRYIQVNIAAFSLKVMQDGKRVLQMRAIVGKPFNTTPVFAGKMTYLVLNPSWNVPRKIFLESLLPRLRTDPGLLAEKGIRILSDWGTNGYEIDPSTIDWSTVDAQNFPYYLRQDPGPNNELGEVKFMFPNKYNVYLHDTPHKELFDASVRNFSHGCVRIQKPMELADYLLRDNPDWDDARIQEAIATGKEQIVDLQAPIPVYFLYLTAWVDDQGVHFRNDIYHRDRLLSAVLP